MSLDYHYRHHDRFLPAALEDRLIGLFARVGGLTLLGLIALAWLAILTWSATDPSLMHATGGSVSNALGYIGATVSDLLLQTFGLACALVLLAPMFWGAELVTNERVKTFSAKATYFPLAILVLAGAFSSLPMFSGWPLHHGYGGILGDAVYSLTSGAMAVVAPQRAGALTGLLSFAFGTAAIAYSIGIELKDITTAIKSRATQLASRARREPILEGLSKPNISIPNVRSWGERLKELATRTNQTDIDVQSANDAYDRHDAQSYAQQSFTTHREPTQQPGYPQTGAPAQADPRQFAAQNYQHHRHQAQPFHVNPATPASAHAYTPAPPHAAFNQPYVPTARPVDPAHAQVRQPVAAPIANPRNERPTQPVNRGHDFDGATDFASHSIAARFAPASAQPTPAEPAPAHAIPATPTPDQPAPQHTTRKSLLTGIKFNGGPARYVRPSLNLLERPSAKRPAIALTKTVLRDNARLLEEVLADFGVKGQINSIKPGPVVTLFELEPARGTKSSRVIGLADDIARSMSAKSARVSVIPGRNAIGIELPNAKKDPVLLREILETEAFKSFAGDLPISLGRSITGEPVIADLARMPHLLIAGTTGSGKSVGVNAMIASLLYRFSPDECRLVMIDPKMLELSVYNGIPHLLTPVVTDPLKAVAALNWVVGEMEERYKRMSKMGVRNINIYNNRVVNAKKRGDMIARTVQTGFDRHTGQAVFEQQQMDMESMPYIVVVIDEFADLMIAAGKEVELAVQRLAQMARAAGIHLIMATQRPSVDVITGTIKANFPTRVSFKVTSKVDSRTILGEQGAEQLLGQGDMLYASGAGNALRVHGPFVSDDEVENIVSFLRERNQPRYVEGVTDTPESSDDRDKNSGDNSKTAAKVREDNDLYDRALALVLRDGKASTSYLQRRLSIGYNRAADLIERMEREEVVSPAGPTGKRKIIATRSASETSV